MVTLADVRPPGSDRDGDVDPVIHDEQDPAPPAAPFDLRRHRRQLVIRELRRAELHHVGATLDCRIRHIDVPTARNEPARGDDMYPEPFRIDPAHRSLRPHYRDQVPRVAGDLSWGYRFAA
jgi:hypothetical protein